ncbi:TonB-dependent receptor [uncultured Tenacibaculum sp.]|uniref:SusC/RagA family TonB-linked outer membrane protein n=1 Tax=uncultured Tenacibaculum sp. TaxID=174713 RepID=UPI00260B51A6|nr:TonB-dependent receptor [uncultured Tenacibaculum sp.]
MNLQTKLTFIAMLFCCLAITAQETLTVSGTVLAQEDNLPIPGANIVIFGTIKGTSTDFDGKFSLKVKKGEVLQISSIGYKNRLITVENDKPLTIVLQQESNVLNEVVVVGYGSQKKSNVTGAVSKLVNKDLEQIGVARVDDALVGQVSGVNIQATEGEAGSAPTIRIRGTGSISGVSDPLIVVDGLVVDNEFLGSLDMSDVASFDVLKDAASTAIYGSRGGNGVIQIITKSGKEGKTRFSYNTFTGLKEARRSDAYTFSVARTAQAELAFNGTLSDRTRYKQLIGTDRSWQDVIFDGGTITNHSFSVRGGTKKTKFSASLGFLKDEGVLLTDNFKRYNLKLKVDSKLSKKFKVGFSLTPTLTERRRFDGSVHDILRQPSWLPLFIDENNIQYVNRLRDNGRWDNVQIGDYAVQRMFDDYDLATGQPIATGGTDISNSSNTNPAAKVLERNRTEERFRLFGSVYLNYKIIDDLEFRTSFSGDFEQRNGFRYSGVEANRNGADAAFLTTSDLNRIHLVSDNYFTYNHVFNEKHSLNAVAGFSTETFDTKTKSITGTGFTSDLSQTLDAATNISDKTSLQYETTFMSFFGRVNYAFDDKYLVSLSFRRDGSSIFGPDSKFGDFPAASVGWIISNEKFLEDSDFLSNLKFRASYGLSGNNRLNTGDVLIDTYPSIALLQATSTILDNNVIAAFDPLNLPNPDLQWEQSREVNLGIDFGFFNNRIRGAVDVYQRNNDKQLLFNPVSVTTGFAQALVNLGEVENRGIELEFQTRNIVTEDFSWSSTILASMNENELINFGDSDGQILNVDSKRAAEWINSVGNPVASFYGWVVDREIPLEFINDPFHPVGGEAQDVYVKDLNGDGLIDDDDKTILGDPYPDLVWSFSNSFRYKNLDISFMWQGSHGAEVRNMGDQYLFNHFNSSQDFDPATTPDQGFIKQKIFTNSIIQDASYISLRNVNIGYNFSNDLPETFEFFTKARVYVTGQNLLYFTADDYTGFNPEFVERTGPLTFGYQRAGSPIARTISLGLNLEF